jgi:hypothetical protein
VVALKPIRRLKHPVTLAAIKADKAFAEWELVRIGRLSVMPVSDVEWDTEDGHYRVLLHGEWVNVPNSSVVTEPNRYGPADWFPEDHPAMPDIVAHGKETTTPVVFACGRTASGEWSSTPVCGTWRP